MERRGRGALQIAIVVETVALVELSQASIRYPVNALRNVALAEARTDLVLLLDVDFILSSSASRNFSLDSRLQQMYRSCCLNKEILVLPAFQARSCETALASAQADKFEVVKLFEDGTIEQFAKREFDKGHRATNYERWKQARSEYALQYEEGFEPFVVAARALIPWYNPIFRGYGRNKVIHIFHCAAFGMAFYALADAWVIHSPHEPSAAFKATFGKGEEREIKLFENIMSLYNESKSEILASPAAASAAYGLHVAPGWWRRRDLLGGWMGMEGKEVPKTLRGTTDLVQRRFLRNLHEHKFSFRQPKLRRILHLESGSVYGQDVGPTLCTTLTADRLSRLLLQVRYF
eukprot:CAMPEP_0177623176 /NCGR_PEP_ID=MMETSP0419_2-20121207/28763_1 /TAXON_ID=582737 /ORGANISM="Tetraselmis sp., Strain GSL018" /LENGTH=347 /DNA_ID=CAMNT_0019123711 /DNA_START=613 /DNA_END=1656 /DNA_ORIENTATION=+